MQQTVVAIAAIPSATRGPARGDAMVPETIGAAEPL